MIGETHLSYRLSRGTFLMLLALAVPLVCIPVHGQEQAAAVVPAPARGRRARGCRNGREAGGGSQESDGTDRQCRQRPGD